MNKTEQNRQPYRGCCTWYKATFATCLLFSIVGFPLVSLVRATEGKVVSLSQSWAPESPAAAEGTVFNSEPAAISSEELLLEALRSLDGPAPETVKDVKSEWQTVRMKVTAYCACPICCGKFADGYTACNHRIRRGDVFVAADKQIAFGTDMIIPGYNGGRPVEVKDRGRLIKGNRLDVFMYSHEQAKEWGCRELDVRVKVD